MKGVLPNTPVGLSPAVLAAIKAGPELLSPTHPDARKYGKKRETAEEFATRIAIFALSETNKIVCPFCNPLLSGKHPAPDASEPMVPNGEYREIRLGGSAVYSESTSIMAGVKKIESSHVYLNELKAHEPTITISFEHNDWANRDRLAALLKGKQ